MPGGCPADVFLMFFMSPNVVDVFDGCAGMEHIEFADGFDVLDARQCFVFGWF